MRGPAAEATVTGEASGEPKIKGALIKDPRDWMRTAYGPEAYQAALSRLSADDRAIVDGPILGGSWYPIAPWDRFQAAMRAEARERRGHSDLQFNMRNMREAGSSIVRGVYKFVLGLMSAESAVSKCVIIFNRAYSEGHCELVTNEKGRATLRYCDASPAFRTNLTNNFGTSVMFVLELNGAKNVNGRVSRDEIVNGKLNFEVTITYHA
jgi:hypothetical protein